MQSTMSVTAPQRTTAVLLVLTITLVAWNLRLTPVAVGPVLPQLSTEFAMSGTLAGFLTSVPTLCFAIFGLLAVRFASHIGLHRAMWVSLAANTAGQIVRIYAPSTTVFLAGTALALAGIGVINVLMPSLVKRHFPLKAGWMTALYSTTQACATALASMMTASLAIRMGSWRGPFWIWTITAIISLIPLTVTVLRVHDKPLKTSQGTIGVAQVGRTKLGWMMAIFFGAQSSQAYAMFGWLPTIYQDAGFDPVTAAFSLTILNIINVPVTFVIPVLTQRLAKPSILVWASGISLAVGFAGIVACPTTWPWLWPVLVACGGGTFPMVLTLVSMRAQTSAGTAALSSFVQSVGYVFASIGPVLMGALHQITGSFSWPVAIQALVVIPLVVGGLYCSKDRFVEDEIA